jgi:hypothetical protein
MAVLVAVSTPTTLNRDTALVTATVIAIMAATTTMVEAAVATAILVEPRTETFLEAPTTIPLPPTLPHSTLVTRATRTCSAVLSVCSPATRPARAMLTRTMP